MTRTLFVNLIFLLLVACSPSNGASEGKENLKGKAQGGFSDLIVIVKEELWDKGLKDDVSFVFAEDIKGLYRKEQNFDVTHIRPKALNRLLKRQRLLLEFEVNRSVENSMVGYKEDKFAIGQLYIKITAKNFDEASSLLLQSANVLRTKVAEHTVKGLQGEISQLSKGLAKKPWGNTSIMIPENYSLVSQEKDFIYYGKKAKSQCESGHNSQCSYQLGLMIGRMKYTSEAIFEKNSFTALRDSLTKKYIIGPEKDVATYMEVENAIPVRPLIFDFDGHYCVEYRGWWNMVNATMGGPFISYLLVDKKSKDLYFLDGFAFAPNFRKRDFLKELEAIIKTVKISAK